MIHLRRAWHFPRVLTLGLLLAGPAAAQEPESPPESFTESIPESVPEAGAVPSAEPPPPATSPPTSVLSADEDFEAPRSRERALELLQQQRLDEAVAMLQVLVEESPGDAATLHLLGIAELARENFPQAVDALRRAADIDPGDTGTRFDLAGAHERAGDPSAAEALYRELMADPDAATEATFRLGVLLAAKERNAEAIELLERVAAAREAAPERAAEASARLTPLYAAVAREHVAALERGDAGAFGRAMGFGTSLVGKNRLDPAMSVFEAVARTHPDQAQGYYWMSRVQITRGELDPGLANLERAAELAPDNLRLRAELGRALEAAGRFDRAEETFSEVLDRAEDPRVVADARRQIGLLQVRKRFDAREWGAALPILDDMLARAPDDDRVIELKADALEALGRRSEADPLYRGLLERNPENVPLLGRVAAVYEARGQHDRARELHGRVLRLAPVGEPARQALDRLGLGRAADLMGQDRPAEALRVFESILELAPDNPAANVGAGMAYRRLQRFDEAEAALRKILERDQGGIAAWIELGQVYEDAGRTEDATSVFEQVARLATTPQEQRMLRERLAAVYDTEAERTSEAFQRGEVEAGRVVALAQRLVQRGFNDHAVRLLEPALSRSPDDARFHFWLGNARQGLGETERALQLFERAGQLSPGNIELMMELAGAYTQAGRLDDAEASWLEVSRATRDERQRRLAERNLGLVRAQIAQDDRDFSRALGEYEKLLRDEPNDPQLLLGQARMLVLLRREGEADRILSRLLESSPGNVGVSLSVAQVYRARGMIDEAVKLHRDLLDANPDLNAVRFELAGLYQETGRWEDAVREYSLLLQRTQGTPQASDVGAAIGPLVQDVSNQGMQLLARGDAAAAEDLFRRLVALLPRNTQALYLLSEVHREQGRRDLQIQRLREAVDIAPTNVPMKRRLAFAYADAGRNDEAAAALDQLLAEFPFDSEVRLRRAELYQAMGDGEAARQEYLTLLEMSPTREWRVRALDRLGLDEARRLQERGQTDQALDILDGLLAISPDDPVVLAARAQVFRQAGRVAEAEAAWKAALEADPGDQEARLELARLLAASGRESDAIRIYHGLAAEGVATAQSDAARRELDELLARGADREINQASALSDTAALEERLVPVGVQAFELGATAVAQRVFEHLVRTAPDSAVSHHWLGRVYLEQKNLADSLVFLRRSSELAPEESAYALWLGRVYARMDIDRSAEQSFERAIDLDPDNFEAHLELGEVYGRTRPDGAAERAFATALQHAGDEAQTARALQGLGLPADPDRLSAAQVDEARRIFDEALSGLPESAAAQYYVAVVFHRSQRYQNAETLYRNLMRSGTGHARSALKLAQLLAETGRIDDSIGLYEELIRGPDAGVAQQAWQGQTELLVAQAKTQAELLDRGQGDPRLARRLGRTLLERRQAAPVVTLMRAALKQGPEVAEIQYLLGRALVEEEEFGPGLAALERSVRLSPPDLAVTLRQHLAIAYERAGRIDDAIRVHQALYAEATDPQMRAQARTRLGLARGAKLVAAGDYRAALREYDDALAQSPDDVLLLTERGRVLVQLGREEEADRTFERVVALAPDSVPVRMRIIDVYESREDSARYLPHAAAIIRIDPFSAEARAARTLLGVGRGRELLQANSPEDAAEVFRSALERVPDDPLMRLELAEALMQQRKFADADRIIVAVLRDYPNLQQALFMRGNLFQRLDRREDAIAQYEQAVAQGAGTEPGQLAMAELERLYSVRVQEMVDAGEDEAAIRELVRQLEVTPGNNAARRALVIMYSRRQRYAEALDQIDELIRLQPGNAVAHAQRGSLLAVLQRSLESAEAYATAISLDTDEQSANNNVRELLLSLSRHHVDEGRPFSAIRDLSMLNERGLGDERTHAVLGSLYRQQNSFDEAARAFRDAVRISPDNALTRFNLADTYEQTHDYDLALLQYRHILRTSEPGGRLWEEARRRAEMWTNRLARFTSQLSYNTTIGDANIEEQDINRTGALNTSFSSQLFYNLGTNFWPTNNLNLRLDTGLSYIANHSTSRDNFFPRIGVSGNLNYQNHFYSFAGHITDLRDLMLDLHQGTSYTASLTGGLRFTDSPLELFRGWTRKRRAETGEVQVDRATLDRRARGVAADPEAENSRLRATLTERFRAELRSSAAATVDPARIFGDGDGAATAAGPELGLEEFAQRAQEEENEVRRRTEAVMEEYRRGRAHLAQGRTDAALASFARVLEAAPGDPMTLLSIAAVREAQGQPAEAERAYAAARAADPENHDIALRFASFYEDHGRLDQAIVLLRETARAVPDTRQGRAAVTRLRALYRRQADIALGEAEPSAAAASMMHEAASGLLELDDAASAASLLEAWLENAGADAGALDLRSRALIALERPADAVGEARAALEQAPDESRYRLTLARALVAAGKGAEAAQVYQGLVDEATDPASTAVAGYELGLLEAGRLEAAGAHGQAREVYRRMLEVRPDDADLLLRAATASLRSDHPDEAAERYRHAIDIAPDDPAPRLALADLLRGQGQDEAANEQLAEAWARAGDEAQRASVRERLGFDGAIESIRKNRSGRALGALEAMQAVIPNDPLVRLNLGVAYQMEGRIPEAEAAFQRLLDADPDNLTARLRLGLLYSDTDRLDRAIPMLERVVADGSGTTAGERARAGLQGLEERRRRTLIGGADEAVPGIQTVQGRVFYSDQVLPSPSIAEAFSYGFGLSYVNRSLDRGDWIVSYTFTVREHEHPLGSDYDYWSHDIGVTYRTPVPNFRGWFGPSENIPGLSAMVTTSYESREYTYVDTYALNVLGDVKRRIQRTNTLSVGLNWQPPGYSQISFNLGYTRGWSRANLPVGITFSPQGVPVAFQSSGLGTFDPNFFTLGMTFQF